MKIILTRSTPKLGNIGDIISVKNGYGRNFLLPKKMAISFSDVNYKVFEQQKNRLEKENSDRVGLAKRVKSTLEAKNIVIIESASDDGQLYGSVKSNSILKEINKLVEGGDLIERSQINFEKPIREIGIHRLNLKIHPEVEINFLVCVSRTSSEAELLLKSLVSSNSAAKKLESAPESEQPE